MPLSPTLAAFGPEALGQPEIRIIADDSTRSIRALPRDYRQIREASAKLDTLPLQILIEVTIAEVTLWNELRYGMEWFFRSGDFRATFSQDRQGHFTSSFPGFSALFSGADASIVLNSLEAASDMNVIFSPRLLALGNQTARLQVGDRCRSSSSRRYP